MIRLSSKQLTGKQKFLRRYFEASNAAEGSVFDANANVSTKNISTLEAELHKDINIQLNRSLVAAKIQKLFGAELAREYERQIEAHEIYVHDETSLKPYCASVSMYPFLLEGMVRLGGESRAPRHLASYCGSFVNLVFALSSQFAGAIATVEFLTYFDHFARKDFGPDYLSTHRKEIEGFLQQVVYSVNQPAAARGYQSVFWNISIYDQYYFESLFADFVFPDGDLPNWISVDLLQRHFLAWFNAEREKALLTFPVVTVALLTNEGRVRSREYADLVAEELSSANSFFIYLSDTPDSLASCCRLRNEIQDSGFSYSLGAGGVATGSLNVITINMNRIVQMGLNLEEQVRKIHKYQVAFRALMDDFQKAGLLTVYDAGFISMDKQYLTVGINGMVEAAEFLGLEIGNNSKYIKFLQDSLGRIHRLNREARREYGLMFNTEFVPAENLGVKNARWDRADGLLVPRDCYNSYFYAVEDASLEYSDKLALHGREVVQFLDGGSALHLNLEEYLTRKQYLLLLDQAADSGCNYFCTNVKVAICNDCGRVTKRAVRRCAHCNSDQVDYATRVIGYLKRISSFSESRQLEHSRRYYHISRRPRDRGSLTGDPSRAEFPLVATSI